SRALRPEHFTTEFHQTDELSLLWLSDLHFSMGDQHAFPRKRAPALSPLEFQVENALNELGVKPAGVLVSGDITWKADRAEFEYAREALRYLMSWGSLQPYQFGICPGNHDLAFSKDPADKTAPITDVSNASRA